jgi:hypothetical protein
MSEPGHVHEDGYRGPAVLHVGGAQLPARALLDARHEPQDGRLHWYGRLTLDGGAALPAHATDGVLATPTGRAAARIGDRDPWGRYRVTGLGVPPYAVAEPDLAG